MMVDIKTKIVVIMICFFLDIFIKSGLSVVIDDFTEYNSDEISSSANINVGVDYSIYHSSPASIKATRDIGLTSAGNWTENNDITYISSSAIDISSYKYFVFWFYDEAIFGDGEPGESIQISINDGDEDWVYEISYGSEDGWRQVVIPLDYFSIPDWEKNGNWYKGDGIFNKANVSQISFSFGGKNPITGNFYLDDIEFINPISITFPVDDVYISSELNNIVVYFWEKMIEQTLLSSENVFLLDETSGTTNNSIVRTFDESENKLSIGNLNLSDSHRYVLKLTNIFLYGDVNIGGYSINFTTQYPVQLTSGNDEVSIQDYEDGTYIKLSANSFDSTENVKITTANVDFNSLSAKTISPDGYKLKQEGKIVFYTHNYSGYSGLKILHKSGEKWEEIPCNWNKADNYIEGIIEELGTYVLIGSDIENSTESIISVKPDSNPFTPNGDSLNDSIKFSYYLSVGGYLTVKIYNSNGELIREIVNKKQVKSGFYSDIMWDGRNYNGEVVEDGLYIYVFKLEYGGGEPDVQYFSWYENPSNTTIKKGVVGVIK